MDTRWCHPRGAPAAESSSTQTRGCHLPRARVAQRVPVPRCPSPGSRMLAPRVAQAVVAVRLKESRCLWDTSSIALQQWLLQPGSRQEWAVQALPPGHRPSLCGDASAHTLHFRIRPPGKDGPRRVLSPLPPPRSSGAGAGTRDSPGRWMGGIAFPPLVISPRSGKAQQFRPGKLCAIPQKKWINKWGSSMSFLP